MRPDRPTAGCGEFHNRLADRRRLDTLRKQIVTGLTDRRRHCAFAESRAIRRTTKSSPGGAMVQRDTPWPAGTPCWVDLGTDDVARATTFYSTLFGWDTQVGPPETGGYVMCEVQARPVAGIGPKMGPGEGPTARTTYPGSDDADATTSKVSAGRGSG